MKEEEIKKMNPSLMMMSFYQTVFSSSFARELEKQKLLTEIDHLNEHEPIQPL